MNLHSWMVKGFVGAAALGLMSMSAMALPAPAAPGVKSEVVSVKMMMGHKKHHMMKHHHKHHHMMKHHHKH